MNSIKVSYKKWILYLRILIIVKHLILIDFYSTLQVKIDLKRKHEYIALSNLSIYYTWKNIKKPYKYNKFKILAATWNEEF